jgi:hypothetical protein
MTFGRGGETLAVDDASSDAGGAHPCFGMATMSAGGAGTEGGAAVRLALEFRLTEETIAGTLTGAGQTTVFWGWLELIGALEAQAKALRPEAAPGTNRDGPNSQSRRRR